MQQLDQNLGLSFHTFHQILPVPRMFGDAFEYAVSIRCVTRVVHAAAAMSMFRQFQGRSSSRCDAG
jgi:hypothetical protein